MSTEKNINNESSNIIDFKYSLDLMQEKSLVIESYDMFLNGLPEHVERLRQDYAAYDAKKLRAIAHNIKGEVAYCGAPEIKLAVESFHDTVKNHPEDKDKAEAELNDLVLAINNFIAVYPNFRSQQDL